MKTLLNLIWLFPFFIINNNFVCKNIKLDPLHYQSNQDQQKKLSATIAHEYDRYVSPVKITYQVYPYGGSKKYEYRWRLKGQKYGNYSNNTTYTLIFDCSINERPVSTIFCQVKDIVSGEIISVMTTHPVEICTVKV
ncbi:hypothetical protein ESY86_09595 [Subsaximicrobium wynnwilliamsii]|uniref:Uncharacterized protein n=1 Tax=Subsaximicrobium wynnwilliamsii TaxID=291179 RepID=A0A5C6ZIG5_9FLAO|nr:hypothetical protein [Subsaximicrobium wynnwilliamsii]TXD83441.1 hypothetical protein ESY87_09215 [Subsaximicrobium wynnwilliamsii]TXD89284.1 hypothetical protein ESY86_09595 [Subsaximicrobium wynnwilliamsii]TXE03121.1 hypothetical protein ESY88_08925 [Subsaximicrobium wynnwilliamsii]